MSDIKNHEDALFQANVTIEQSGLDMPVSVSRSTVRMWILPFLITTILGITFGPIIVIYGVFIGTSQAVVGGITLIVSPPLLALVFIGIFKSEEATFLYQPFIAFEDGFFCGSLSWSNLLRGEVPIIDYGEISKVIYQKCEPGYGGKLKHYPNRIIIKMSSGEKFIVRDTSKLDYVAKWLYDRAPEKCCKRLRTIVSTGNK